MAQKSQAAQSLRSKARQKAGRRKRTYSVKSGDNFLKIAKELFGQKEAARGARRLARANSRVKQVKAGMVLQVPPEEVQPVQIGEQQPVDPFAGVGL